MRGAFIPLLVTRPVVPTQIQPMYIGGWTLRCGTYLTPTQAAIRQHLQCHQKTGQLNRVHAARFGDSRNWRRPA